MVSPQMQDILDLLRKGRAATEGRQVPLEEQRARYRKLAKLLPAAPGVGTEEVDAGGVPAEWHRPPGGDDGAALLYLHGGGYAIGGRDTHGKLAGHLAAALGCPVLLADYRLAPEHPHPAAVTDATAAFRWLLDQGLPADRLAVGGDSAGGGLAVTTCLSLRDAGEGLPAAAVLISPWTDMEGTGDSMTSRADADPMVFADSLQDMAGWFLAGHDPRDPLVSPLHGDLAGLPPTLVHVGDHERLLDDATRLADRLAAAGVDVTCEVWPEMVHVWHYFAGQVPEADAGVARVAEWLAPRLGLKAA